MPMHWSRRTRPGRSCTSPRRVVVSPIACTSTQPTTPTPLPATTAPRRHRARERCSPACSPRQAPTSPRHETLERAQRQAEDFAVLAAEYETLVRGAARGKLGSAPGALGTRPWPPRTAESKRRARPTSPRPSRRGGAWPRRGWRPPEARRRPLARGRRGPRRRLHGRVNRRMRAAGSNRRANTNLIAGSIPRAAGVSDPDLTRALDERANAMQRRRESSPSTPFCVTRPGSADSAFRLVTRPGATG